ncbi:hypothetical protein M1N83_00620 [Dehalococcoidia bacterium]|nr:hypothetical protein [Dehalococcoidia bacterium]
MERKPLKSLVKEVLDIGGCLVEENGDLLEVVMTPEIAGKLGLKEHEILYFTPQESRNGQFISYSSEILDSISELMEDKGHFCKVHLPRLYLKKERLDQIISQKLSLANSVLRSSWAVERTVSYLLLNFKYSAISEEKKEGIITVVVNELTLASPGEMMSTLLKGYYEGSHKEWRVEVRRPLEEVFSAACKVAEHEIRRELTDFVRRLDRRLNKDVARIEGYYGTLKEEVEARIQKRGLVGADQERELSRIRAIDVELKRKIKEQRDRYSMRVNVELLNAIRVTMLASLVILRIRRKNREKRLELVWNPLLKDLELPACEGCFRPTGIIYLCDEELHHICPRCHECPSCHKAVCRVCYPQACPKCGGKFQER